MKKLFAVLLALTLVLSMGTIALAAGNGTITINKAVEGETYSVYKMFDFAPVAGSETNGRYTVVAGWEAFLTGEGSAYLKENAESGTIEWVAVESETEEALAIRKAELAKKAVAYAKANNIAATASKAADATGTVEFTGLDLGYYAIDTSLGALCALTTTTPAAEVNEKNQKPDIEKKIVEGNELVDANNVAIGDKVDYQTTVTVGKGLTNYVVHDKMSAGLTPFDGEDEDTIIDVTVTVGNATVAAGNNTYTVVANPTDDCTFEVVFSDNYIGTLDAGDEIVITYSATLNENAVVGATGNPNTVTLSYTNETEVETKEDNVITYTTEFTVEKVDGEGSPLAGAGFTLYKKNADGAWVAIGDEKLIDKLNDGEKALYTWTGLEAGEYKLEETTVPAGYNKAKDIEFEIECEVPGVVDSINDTADWSDDSDNVNEADEKFNAEVVNKTGSLLPETGGIGTTIFYVVGSILMLAALVLLVSKKRMANFA